jgi:hypothetical protein
MRGRYAASSLDPAARYVDVLDAAGIETYESCEGGEGHFYAEPAVCFYGARGQGFRALTVALQHGFPVRVLRPSMRTVTRTARTGNPCSGEVRGARPRDRCSDRSGGVRRCPECRGRCA